MGYGTYAAFLIGFASNIIIIYKLAVEQNSIVGPYFHSLGIFTLLALAVAGPTCVAIGYYHMKRTGAYAADASVSMEANPYMYKILPGKEQEVFLPLWVTMVRSLVKLLEQERSMTDKEKDELDKVLEKANALLAGQYVGMQKPIGA